MRVVITGGAGFIGSHIADACVAAGHEVTVIDDLSSGKTENLPDGVSFHRCDIQSTDAATAVTNAEPQILIHHAAQMSVTRSVSDPAFDARVNLLGLINLLEAGKQVGLERVIFASSGGTVYGDSDAMPFDENVPTHPVCPYGVSKLAGEHYLFYYHKVFGIPYTALRYANVYGPRQDPHGEAGVVAIFSKQLLADKDCTIFGDGSQTRDYVYVGDVVRANMAALESDYIGALNIGTSKETDVNVLYAEIKQHVGGAGTAVNADPRDGELLRSVLDASKAKAVLDWQAEVDLADGLASTVDFFRAEASS